jgi:hypothetical protein
MSDKIHWLHHLGVHSGCLARDLGESLVMYPCRVGLLVLNGGIIAEL